MGATLTKDVASEGDPEDVKAAFEDNVLLTPLKKMLGNMIAELDPETLSEISQKGRTIDINGVAVKKEHGGQGLLKLMTDLTCSLAREQGFRNGVCLAGNSRTEAVLKKFAFKQIGKADATQAEFKG